MGRSYLDIPYHEAEERRQKNFAQDSAASYKKKYLHLRKEMRNYVKETGLRLPTELEKLIGLTR